MAETPSLVTNWLAHLDQQGRSTHTLKAYRRAWHHLADWYETHYDDACDPTRLIGRDIRDWPKTSEAVTRDHFFGNAEANVTYERPF